MVASWLMSAPLVILAVGPILGGGINFPAWDLDFPVQVPEPSVPPASFYYRQYGHQMGAVVDHYGGGADRAGVGPQHMEAAYHPQLEPNFLRCAWYFDDLGGSGFRRPTGGRHRAGVRDGPQGRRRRGERHRSLSWPLRPAQVQNGYLRSTLFGIGVGVVILLAYLSFRTGA